MTQCAVCGSYAINHHRHGRDGSDGDKCDVCYWRSRAERLAEALRTAEAALADIGDADREPGDDVAWCERRAAQALPMVRALLRDLGRRTSND